MRGAGRPAAHKPAHRALTFSWALQQLRKDLAPTQGLEPPSRSPSGAAQPTSSPSSSLQCMVSAPEAKRRALGAGEADCTPRDVLELPQAHPRRPSSVSGAVRGRTGPGGARGAPRRPPLLARSPHRSRRADAAPSPASPALQTPTQAAESAATMASVEQQPQHPVPRSLSVHWSEELEQQHPAGGRSHLPAHHSQQPPDKGCLKAQPSSFPFLEEAAQLEGLMRRPRALVLAQLNGAASPVAAGGAPAGAAPLGKRSRLAAFGQ